MAIRKKTVLIPDPFTDPLPRTLVRAIPEQTIPARVAFTVPGYGYEVTTTATQAAELGVALLAAAQEAGVSTKAFPTE